MKRVKFGNLEVSNIAMGCMGFSHGYGKVPEESYAIEAIRDAYNYGCNFFDTAERYGEEQFYMGHNEEIVGKAVEPFRDDVVLATKLHIDTKEVKEFGLYNTVYNHLKASLKRLRTDYVDLYYLHRVNPDIMIEDVAIVMGKLIQEGLIKGWGLSQVEVDVIEKAHKITPLSAIQNIYSMMERDYEKEVIPYCLKNNILFVPFSPIASGFLSGKVTPGTKFEGDDVRKWVPQLQKENLEKNLPLLDMLEKFAKEKNATTAQISLAWMIHKYPHVVPIPGSKNKKRILENLQASQVILNKEEFDALEKSLAQYKIYGQRKELGF